MSFDQVLYILAVIGFILAGVGVSWPAQSPLRFEWLAAAALTLNLLV